MLYGFWHEASDTRVSGNAKHALAEAKRIAEESNEIVRVWKYRTSGILAGVSERHADIYPSGRIVR